MAHKKLGGIDKDYLPLLVDKTNNTRANEILSILVKKGMISKEGGSKNIKYVLK